jgi:hypothetical protein
MDSGMVTMSECDVREDAIPYHSWSANRNEWKALYTCYGREDANLDASWLLRGFMWLHDFLSRRFWWERLNGPAKRFTPSLNKSQKFLNPPKIRRKNCALFGQRWHIFGNKTVRSVWMNVIQMEFGC